MARQDLHSYPDEYYYPEALKSGVLTREEMRAEYSKLRAIANRRLQALGNSEFSSSQSYLRNRNKFSPLSEITTERELIMKLYEVKKFTSARSGSVSGLRDIQRQTLETAQERGLTFLNKNNIAAFGQFMEEARQKGYSKIYGSERIAELFGTAARKQLDPKEIMKDFEYWNENRNELEKQPKITNKKKVSASDYRKRIDADKEQTEKLKRKK